VSSALEIARRRTAEAEARKEVEKAEAAVRQEAARAKALARRAIIEEHYPDIIAVVEDLRAAFPGARMVKITSPEITWEAEGIEQYTDEDCVHPLLSPDYRSTKDDVAPKRKEIW